MLWGEDYLVNVLCLVHLDESLVVDRQLIYRRWEAKDKAEDFSAAWLLLLNETTDEASILKPLRDQVRLNECVVKLACTWIDNSVESDDWIVNIFLYMNDWVDLWSISLKLIVVQTILLSRQLLNQDSLKHLLLLQLTKVLPTPCLPVLPYLPSTCNIVILPLLLLPEPLDLQHVMFASLFFIFGVKLLFDSLDETIQEAE